MDNRLVASGLTRRYHGRTVLDALSLTVEPGEVVGLLGPNGAGKSTGFGIIAGLVKPHAGTVSLGGVCMDGLPLWKRVSIGLGFLAQDPSVVRTMSVEGNLALAGTDSETTARLLEELGLASVARTRAGDLSGGERRRLEIARCLAMRPRIVVMDEPFSAVDPVGVEALQRIIRDLARQGMGILVSDHSVQATLGVCDRAIIVDGGRVMAEGTPAVVVDNDLVRTRYLGGGFVLAGAERAG